jgi:hypothetical protein
MKTTDGYELPEEHLEVIRNVCNVNGQDFNITLIQKMKRSYQIEGTYKGIDKHYTAEIEFDYIKQEIRNNRINDVLNNK